MFVNFKIIPPGQPKQDKTLPKGKSKTEKKQIKEDMRTIQNRLARSLLRAVRKRAEHQNYKEI